MAAYLLNAYCQYLLINFTYINFAVTLTAIVRRFKYILFKFIENSLVRMMRSIYREEIPIDFINESKTEVCLQKFAKQFSL